MKRPARTTGLPFTAVHGNLLFARGACAAVYRLDTPSYAFLSAAEKGRLHARLAWWMLKAGADFSLYRVTREYPADAYLGDTVDLIDERTADRAAWERLLATHAEHMAASRSFTPEVYAIVALKPASLVPWASRPSRDPAVVRDTEAETFETLTANLKARRATTLEIQWLLRRATVRGVTEPDTDPHWQPPALTVDGGVWHPGRADTLRFAAAITEHARSVHVQGEDGESRQAFLAMGATPKTARFPGDAELLFAPLEPLEFPVDAVAHVKWVPNKTMQGRADTAVRDARNAIEDAAARLLDRQTESRGNEALEVQAYFAGEPFPPGLDTSLSLAVGAPSPDELAERVKRVRRAYGNVRLYQSHALQAALYADHLPRPDGAQVRDYRQLLTREALAAMMPVGSHHAGADTGIVIGHTIPGPKRWVKYNPLQASAENRAGAVLMDGTLGAGKTIAGQLLAVQAARRGSLIVGVDPKEDHSLHRLLPGVHVISLSDLDQNRGLLDPLVVAPPELREELASSYMMEILPSVQPEWQTEIIDAVRTVLRDPNPSSLKVVDRLLDSPDPHARSAGKALRVWADWGLGRLAFSDGTGPGVDTSHQTTTIRASALTLPPAGTPRSSYDQSERISVATLKLIAAYAMRLVSGDRSVHKLLLLDEAHVLTMTADGRRFLERLIRMGRSMNVTVVLLTQLVGDLGELSELVGVRFSFRQETDQQARANLRLHGLDDDNHHLTGMLREFTGGACLMGGLDGRVAAVQFDVLDPEFLRIADTNPTRVDVAALERQALT